MATSVFSVYASSDKSAPELNGLTGSLINVLDACLITGFGTRTSAGWSHPLPNEFGYACYQPPSGSRMTLFVNDAGPTSSAATREALWVGYENLVSFTQSVGLSAAMNCGSGSGQFPTTVNLQNQTTNLASGIPSSGSFVVRKSATSSSLKRDWIMFADAYTMYLFISCGDSTTTRYIRYTFGDFFSLRGASDTYRCGLHARWAVNLADVTGRYDWADQICAPNTTVPNGFACPRNFGPGISFPVILCQVGDAGKCNLTITITNTNGNVLTGTPMAGVIPTPNPVDNTLYMSPLWLADSNSGTLRGRVRGCWQVCHALNTFSDGQVIQGANELAGKTFQIVSPGNASGFWAMEISPTVETN